MKKYKCWWPECTYETTSRSKIDFHHVTPKEINPHPSNKCTIPLCKTHHALIFHPDAKTGQHSIHTSDSLIINTVCESTNGKVVLYETLEGENITYFTRTGDTVKD